MVLPLDRVNGSIEMNSFTVELTRVSNNYYRFILG